MVFSHAGERHFTKDFGNGTVSHRRILPGADLCSVKVTEFLPAQGFSAEKITNAVDETVIVISGRIDLTFNGETTRLERGAVYHAEAGETYGLRVLEPCDVICVFSRAADGGPFPDDE